FASETVKAEFNQKGGFVHVDPDKFHGDIEDLKKGKYTSSETISDCKKIALLVRDYAVEGRRNILEEGIYRFPNSLSDPAERAHRTGYACEIIAIATPREESRLSVLERRENVRDKHGYVRDVPESVQDQSYNAFRENLLKDADRPGGDAAKLDRVRVMDRAGGLLYDSAGDGLYKDVIEALDKGRSLTNEQVTALTRRWEALREACIEKGIPGDELARVDEGIQLFKGYKDVEQHQHAMHALGQNRQRLCADARYGSHTEAEQVKAAYYRGVFAKKQAFEGKGADLHGIDTILANREALRALPDVAELTPVLHVLSGSQYRQQRLATAQKAADAAREAFWDAGSFLSVLRAQIESHAKGQDPIAALDNAFRGEPPASPASWTPQHGPRRKRQSRRRRCTAP
ncbi:MAG: zeta toxin family protein, partial [Betaproteobacteria bacterium]|nr:zeta toxin family protein [Betaproteobacteria bacterium]